MIRYATDEETGEILEAYCEYAGLTVDELSENSIYIREDYTTDCPGYQGPVALIHWGGDPSLITPLIFRVAGAGYAWTVAESDL